MFNFTLCRKTAFNTGLSTHGSGIVLVYFMIVTMAFSCHAVEKQRRHEYVFENVLEIDREWLNDLLSDMLPW
jgi:hypothetical protein